MSAYDSIRKKRDGENFSIRIAIFEHKIESMHSYMKRMKMKRVSERASEQARETKKSKEVGCCVI